LQLGLEDLSQIPVFSSAATLTDTGTNTVPASVTVITHEDIITSGARSLDELLEIFVPALAYMYKVQGNQLGIRGIISDRNNKILLTVNGRNMNVLARDGGAVTERWFSTLGDIRQVTVVNGPGSAVYGPGAIAGVIAIETFDGTTFEGSEVSFKGGLVEEFVMGEVRHGQRLANGQSLFLYYGADKYEGAEDAPHKLAYDTVNRPWLGPESIPISANEDIPFFTTSDNGSFQDMIRQKFHAQLDGDSYRVWMRFTRSGSTIPGDQTLLSTASPDYMRRAGAANQQLTLNGEYTQELDATLDIDYSLSYMTSDVVFNMAFPEGLRGWREDNTRLRALLHYTPDFRHDLALGAEYSYTTFGRKSRLHAVSRMISRGRLVSQDTDTASYIGSLAPDTRWYSDMVSLFGEYQWHLDEHWTSFAGMRLDKHRFTPWMFSPRLALVFQPDSLHSFKLTYNRSVRHGDDADLYQQNELGGGQGDLEEIDYYEFIYSLHPGEALQFDLSGYFFDHDVVAWNPVKKFTEELGTLQAVGVEARLAWSTENYLLVLSHNFTKQLDFDLADDSITVQNISASPYGYGNDLANWNNHITKLRFEYRLNSRLSWWSSLRVFWGMPGAVDLADYNRQELRGSATLRLEGLPLYKDSKRAFEESVYLDTGAAYQWSDAISVNFHLYNLLGLMDEDYNKRNHFQRTSQYRDAEPSVALRLTYRFQ